jgi:quercetin dioxygenase-like cupin family protein
MTQKPAIFLRPGEGERLDYLDGDVSVVLASGDATGGAFSAVEHRLAPGVAGPPKHYHERMCDSFYVLEGTLSLWVEDRWEAAGPGSFACFPPRVVHTFANNAVESQLEMAAPVRVPGGLEVHGRHDAESQRRARRPCRTADRTLRVILPRRRTLPRARSGRPA